VGKWTTQVFGRRLSVLDRTLNARANVKVAGLLHGYRQFTISPGPGISDLRLFPWTLHDLVYVTDLEMYT
jgi:hypothetical protein